MNELQIPEYIICAAIHYDDGKTYRSQRKTQVESGFVLCGHRHCDIIALLPEDPTFLDTCSNPGQYPLRSKGFKSTTQGFITSTGRFVDRHEAYDIALKMKQIDETGTGTLYSEDLY